MVTRGGDLIEKSGKFKKGGGKREFPDSYLLEKREAPSAVAVRKEEACLELMSEAVREERRRMEQIKEEMQRIKEILPDELELYIRGQRVKSKRAARSRHLEELREMERMREGG